MYQIIVKDLAGNTVGNIDRYKNLNFKKVLNREGDFKFDMSLFDQKATPDYIAHRQREVYIHRNGDIVFGGDMITDQGSAGFTSDDVVTISGKGFLDRFNYRVSGPGETFTDDAGNIVQSLFNETEALSPTGITFGSIDTSVTRTVDSDRKSLYQTFIDLTNLRDGIDLEVTQTKVLNVLFPKGTDKSDIATFTKGRNIAQVDYTHDFSKPVNEAIVEGNGYGGAMPVEISDDTSLQASYNLFQEVIPYKDATDTQQLIDYGKEQIFKRGVAQGQFKIYQEPGSDPDWTSVDVGDYVRIDVEHGYLSIHATLRISIIEVNYTDGVEQVMYTVGIV